MNKSHISEEMKLTRQIRDFEQIRSVHRGFKF